MYFPTHFIAAAALANALLMIITNLPSVSALDPGVTRAKQIIIHRELLKMYLMQRRMAEARDEFQHLVTLEPNDAPLHFEFGKLLVMSGDRDSAMRHIRLAAKLDPDNQEYVGWLHRCLGTPHPVKEVAINTSSKKFERTSMAGNSGRPLLTIVRLPATTPRLNISALRADVAVSHAKRDDIVVLANYKNHWVNKQDVITQTLVAAPPPGVFVTANGNVIC